MKLVKVAHFISAIYQQIVPYGWKWSQMEDIFLKIQYLKSFLCFPSYLCQINTFFTGISGAKVLFLASDRQISDHTQIYSLIFLCIHNLLQNIFHSSPTLEFLPNRLRNCIKISDPSTKPPKKIMRALPFLELLSMLQYRHSFEVVSIFFVPHKIGLKKLFRTFFRILLSVLEAEI